MRNNRVRITGGEYRSRQLSFPSIPGLRPSNDRVRETLFNWLGQDLTGWRCLDLFAGSGALGFECLSRGAAAVVMVERDRQAHASLADNAAALRAERLELIRGDALHYLRQSPPPFDLVLLDPPFHGAWLERLLPRMDALVKPDGLLYVESEAAIDWPSAWRTKKSGRSGMVWYTLLERARAEEGAAASPA